MKMGRLRSGTLYPIMVMPPENRPAAPTPATARPTMSMGELTAAPQITEPSSKMASAIM
jgi:hypothetical protein